MLTFVFSQWFLATKSSIRSINDSFSFSKLHWTFEACRSKSPWESRWAQRHEWPLGQLLPLIRVRQEPIQCWRKWLSVVSRTVWVFSDFMRWLHRRSHQAKSQKQRHLHQLGRWAASCKKAVSKRLLLCQRHRTRNFGTSQVPSTSTIHRYRCSSWWWCGRGILHHKSCHDSQLSQVWRLLPRNWWLERHWRGWGQRLRSQCAVAIWTRRWQFCRNLQECK